MKKRIPPHVALLHEVLQDVLESSNDGVLSVLCRGRAHRIQVWVREGSFHYPLQHDWAGWGSIIGENKTAAVEIYAVDAVGGCLMKGTAELRVSNAYPDYNAEQFSRAVGALIRQGALARESVEWNTQLVATAPCVDLRVRMTRWCRRINGSFRARLSPVRDQWVIGLLPATAVSANADFPWGKVVWIIPHVDEFIADPFLVENEGLLWLFYERLLFSEGKGTLCVSLLDVKTGTLGQSKEILRHPFHLSFPNVFKYDGVWYMLPEQARSGKTTLYKSVQFPYEWVEHRDLLTDFPGIDPVLYFHNQRWWLFVTHGVHPCSENNLYIFSANSLEDDFFPHPMNPVSSGLYGSRMAGPIGHLNKKLVRPSQDGRAGYGMGVVMHEILELNMDRYLEVPLCAWPADSSGSFPRGFHSYMQCGDWLVIDGQRKILLQ